MKKTIFLLLIFLGTLVEAAPLIEFPKRNYLFEAVPEGLKIQHRFIVKNTGNKDLRIYNINPG